MRRVSEQTRTCCSDRRGADALAALLPAILVRLDLAEIADELEVSSERAATPFSTHVPDDSQQSAGRHSPDDGPSRTFASLPLMDGFKLSFKLGYRHGANAAVDQPLGVAVGIYDPQSSNLAGALFFYPDRAVRVGLDGDQLPLDDLELRIILKDQLEQRALIDPDDQPHLALWRDEVVLAEQAALAERNRVWALAERQRLEAALDPLAEFLGIERQELIVAEPEQPGEAPRVWLPLDTGVGLFITPDRPDGVDQAVVPGRPSSYYTLAVGEESRGLEQVMDLVINHGLTERRQRQGWSGRLGWARKRQLPVAHAFAYPPGSVHYRPLTPEEARRLYLAAARQSFDRQFQIAETARPALADVTTRVPSETAQEPLPASALRPEL